MTETSAIPSILWDVDGTLVDSEPWHEQALRKTLEDEGVQPPIDLHSQLLGLSAEAIHGLFQKRFGIQRDFEDWLQRRWGIYLAGASALKPRPGAIEAFEAAEALGWKQAVVSNASRVIVLANLKAIGVANRVQAIVSADDVSNPKPHPEPYLRAQQLLASSDGAVFAVEDSAVGTRAAIAAKCKTFFWPQADHAPVSGASFLESGSTELWSAITQEALIR